MFSFQIGLLSDQLFLVDQAALLNIAATSHRLAKRNRNEIDRHSVGTFVIGSPSVFREFAISNQVVGHGVSL